MEDRLDTTKGLDELNERVAELQRQNEEEREAAEERLAERNEERVRLQAQIAVN